jgi:CTP:molybdopterin cytidylyltransferase MocA
VTGRAILSGVVLAGGKSGRMGELKPLLPLDNAPAVVRSVRAFTDIGVEPVVVLGFSAARVAEVLLGSGASHVINHGFERGMYSSVVTGISAADPAADWLSVLPVDAPLVRAETIGHLVRAAVAATDVDVAYPVYDGRRGHPPVFRGALREEVLLQEPTGGLRALLATHEDRALDVPVDDPGIIVDMDRPEDYERLAATARNERVPAPGECRKLLDRWRTPPTVRAHCEAVAGMAAGLGRALNKAGACLNLPLLEAAALLHDVSRDQRDHAAAGAARLAAGGYPRVARVVAQHMDMHEPVPPIPGESEVLYLADKLVDDTSVVSLQHRLVEATDQLGGDAVALAAATRRLESAMTIAATVERLTGRPLLRLTG